MHSLESLVFISVLEACKGSEFRAAEDLVLGHHDVVKDFLVKKRNSFSCLLKAHLGALKEWCALFVHAAALHASFLVVADCEHILLDHHLEHANGLLASLEAVLKLVIFHNLAHGPGLFLHELHGVGNVIPASSSFFIHSKSLGNGLSPRLHWVALPCHAVLNTCFELHTFDESTLELLAGLLHFLSSLLTGLSSEDCSLVFRHVVCWVVLGHC